MSAGKAKEILIVDDRPTTRRIIKNLLGRLGFDNVVEATDGGDALDKMRNRSPDLIFSGWNMEPMTGLQFLREVRADGHLRTVPFIMVTAESKPENVAAAKAAGANNYIVKPFTAETLKGKVAAVFRSTV